MTISREASNLESKKLPIKFRPPSNLSNSVNFVSKLLLTILLVTPELPFRRRISSHRRFFGSEDPPEIKLCVVVIKFDQFYEQSRCTNCKFREQRCPSPRLSPSTNRPFDFSIKNPPPFSPKGPKSQVGIRGLIFILSYFVFLMDK